MIVRSIHTLIVCAVVLLTLNVKQTASTTTLLSSSRNPLSIVHGAHTALSHTDMTTDLSTLVDKYMKAPNSSDQERTASLLHTSRDSLHHSEYHHNSNDGRVLDGEVVGEAGEHGDLDSGIDHTTDHNNGRVGMEHDRVGSGRKLLSLSTAASFSSLSSRVGIRMKEDGATGDATAKKAETEETPVGMCEVCVYVVENKQQAQPFLCRGLKDSNYQSLCVQTMESLMWWITNEVYWLNYGCQRKAKSVEWVRPCPAHAVCSWIEDLHTRKPFCPSDPYYEKPA